MTRAGGRASPSRVGAAVGLVLVLLGGAACGGDDAGNGDGGAGGAAVTAVRAETSCTDWPRATDDARRRIAAELKRGSQTTAERLEQIEAACKRYGDVSIEKALEMLAVDEHRPTG